MRTNQEYRVGDRVRIIREAMVKAIGPYHSEFQRPDGTYFHVWTDGGDHGATFEVLEKALPEFRVGDVLENSSGTRFLRTVFHNAHDFDIAQWRGTDDKLYGEDTLISSIRMVGGYTLYRGSEVTPL